MTNHGQTPAPSIHVYSPRLRGMSFFKVVPGAGLHRLRTEAVERLRPDRLAS